MRKPAKSWDLYCGIMGAGSGVHRGLTKLDYDHWCLGVNHNEKAVVGSRLNHPEHTFLQTGVDQVSPRLYFKNGQVLLGWASPECIFHSSARGGRPIRDQERSTAWCTVRWSHQTRPKHLLFENVPEFKDWGPLKPKLHKKTKKLVFETHVLKPGKKKKRRVEVTTVPFQQEGRTFERWLYDLSKVGFELCYVKDPAHKAETFNRWIKAHEALGYEMDWKIIVCADYGDPTTRRRLFVQGALKSAGVRCVWPNPTHAKPDKKGQIPEGRLPWITARQILDLSDLGTSIFERPRPLSAKTLNRILIGLLKYGLAEFILPSQGYDDRTRPTSIPLQTVKTNDRGIAVVQPVAYMLPGFGERVGQEPRTHSIDETAPAVTASGHLHLAQPILIYMEHKGGVESADRKPIKTITTARGGAVGVAQPFLLPKEGIYRGNTAKSVDEPTVAVIGDGRINLATTFVLPQQAQGKPVKSLDEPVSPVTTKGAEAIVSAECIVQVSHGNAKGKKKNEDNRRSKPLDESIGSVTGSNDFGVASAAVVKLRGTSTADSIDKTIGAIAAQGQHHGLMTPIISKSYGTGIAKPIDDTLDAVTVNDRFAVATPFVLPHPGHHAEAKSPDKPLPTVTATSSDMSLVNTCVIQTAHKGADAARVKSLDEPVPPVAGNRGDAAIVTLRVCGYDGRELGGAVLHLNGLAPGGKGRPVLEVGEARYEIEIYFRMLKVVELARAQSFPDSYKFYGTKTDAVKQIGNAVPGLTAEALTLAAVSQNPNVGHLLLKAAA